jgi:ureidoglycolate lyase
MIRTLTIMPLTREAFAPFGDVVEAGATSIAVNQGFARRSNDLAFIDVAEGGGTPNISLFVAQPRPQPVAIKLMERHPLGSQLFHPLQDQEWLVVVCTDPHASETYRAFRALGQQGVNYTRNTWHHPLLVRDADSRFIIVDRKGPGKNLEEVWLDQAVNSYGSSGVAPALPSTLLQHRRLQQDHRLRVHDAA